MQSHLIPGRDAASPAGIKAVLFDLDDTLFDRRRAQLELVAIIRQESADLFRGIDKETVTQAFLDSEDVALQEFNAGASVDQTRASRSKRFLQILELNEEYSDRITASYLRSYPLVNTPVAGAKSVVRSLAPKYQVGVISNGSPDIQHHKLNGLGIENLLCCTVLSEEIGIRKPDPRIFQKAAALLGRKPGECLYVGDSYDADIIGARNSGMLTCWFNPQRMGLAETGIRPDLEIGSLNELLHILDCEQDKNRC